tara:strand:- start:310 stop:1272 length:963 start_codon:yes stop_codon:yes gene_type:complete
MTAVYNESDLLVQKYTTDCQLVSSLILIDDDHFCVKTKSNYVIWNVNRPKPLKSLDRIPKDSHYSTHCVYATSEDIIVDDGHGTLCAINIKNNVSHPIYKPNNLRLWGIQYWEEEDFVMLQYVDAPWQFVDVRAGIVYTTFKNSKLYSIKNCRGNHALFIDVLGTTIVQRHIETDEEATMPIHNPPEIQVTPTTIGVHHEYFLFQEHEMPLTLWSMDTMTPVLSYQQTATFRLLVCQDKTHFLTTHHNNDFALLWDISSPAPQCKIETTNHLPFKLALDGYHMFVQGVSCLELWKLPVEAQGKVTSDDDILEKDLKALLN